MLPEASGWTSEFLDSLPAADGMRLQLYRNFEPLLPPESLGSKLAAGLVEDVRRQPRQLTRSERRRHHHRHSAARPRQAIARDIAGRKLSRRAGQSQNDTFKETAGLVGGAGVLLGLMLSFWTASRVTRPLRDLASSVRESRDGQVGHARPTYRRRTKWDNWRAISTA